MDIINNVIEFIFSAALFINAILFVPQAINIFQKKTAEGVSLTTFLGFLLIQFAIVLHAILKKDYLLLWGYVLSMLTCGTVVVLILIYRKHAQSNEIKGVSLSEILEQMPGHVYWKNKVCTLIGCNINNWRNFGLSSANELIGKSDYDLFNKEEANRLRLIDEEVIRTGNLKILEEEATTFDGKKAIYLSHKAPLKNKKNEIVGLVGISIDITDSKKAILDQLEMYENIIAKLPGHIYWQDKSGVYLGCNEQQAIAAGLKSPRNIVGKTNADLPWNKNRPDIVNALENINKQVIESGIAITIEEPAHAGNNQSAIFLSTKQPLFDRNNNIIGLLGISIDISDLKKVEKELVQEKEKAEAASRAKTQFLQNMRHDMRTPLTGIVGFAEIIKNASTDPNIKEYVDNLVISCNALLNLHNQILEFIEVDAGELPILNKKFDLKKKLTEVIALNQATAHQKGVNLSLSYDEAIPHYLIGDPNRIYWVVLELVTNALKFTNQGYVKIIAALAKDNDNDEIIKIVVEDTGIGIEPEHQQSIYTKFGRLSPSYKGIYKGMGLGLSVIKKFIEELQGELYVESKPNQGSQFTIVLKLQKPLLDEALGSEDLKELILEKTTIPTTVATKARPNKSIPNKQEEVNTHVLVVEDSAIAAQVAVNILTQMNCSVDVATEGLLAVKLVKENHYDLILMDIGLPDIDGLETTKRIRANKNSNQRVPIVALTAHVDDKSKADCITIGMDDVLTKPLSREKAQEIVNTLVYHQDMPITNGKDIKAIKLEEYASLPLLDFQTVLKQFGDEKSASEILTLFANSLHEVKKELHSSHDVKDWDSIQKTAHRLKGETSYCGLKRLYQTCFDIDDAIKTKKDDHYDDLYRLMLQVMDATQDVLKTTSLIKK